MVEVLSSRSEIGQLRRKCDKYDECIDKWKKKASALQKQCQDLNQVSLNDYLYFGLFPRIGGLG